jgi:hypothetical protein
MLQIANRNSTSSEEFAFVSTVTAVPLAAGHPSPIGNTAEAPLLRFVNLRQIRPSFA